MCIIARKNFKKSPKQLLCGKVKTGEQEPRRFEANRRNYNTTIIQGEIMSEKSAVSEEIAPETPYLMRPSPLNLF